jgi:radical SAM superfamily enzyme YgiQ (UPF0313 family)
LHSIHFDSIRTEPDWAAFEYIMKFLFVNLDWSGLVSKKTFKIHFSLPPLDLLLLHNSLIGTEHSAKIFDCFVESGSSLPPLLNESDWIVVTTTPYHMWQCPNVEWENIKKALELFPCKKVVLVGLHASVFPEQTLRETGVHAVIRREPETVFKSFLNNLDWKECPGVSYLEDDQYKENSLAGLPPMDELVIKDYAVDISRYAYFLLGKRSGVFEASRGCPWKCTFCDQEMYSWKYRTKSPAVFAEEVARSVEQTGMQTAYFYDLEFTIQNGRPEQICEELMMRGVHKKLKWACQTRADMINPEMLKTLKKAGCSLIHFGVESANPEVLKATNKKITLEKIREGVTLAKRMGFETACFFMFGLPGEKAEQFDNTLEFARDLNPTYASFHFAVPFPGTPLYEQYLKEKGLAWGIWPSTYFDQWSHAEISAFIRRAFIRFYLIPKRVEFKQFGFRLQNLPDKLKYFASMTG